MREVEEGSSYGREISDKVMVEVDEAYESLHVSLVLQSRPIADSSDFNWVYRNLVFQDDQSEVFNLLPIELTLFWAEIAGLLVIPKNIMRGSKRPRLVQKAAFHSSSGLIHTLLNPHRTSSFVKYLVPWSWEISSEMRERGYLFLIITAFSMR